jgi:hypothetical protein
MKKTTVFDVALLLSANVENPSLCCSLIGVSCVSFVTICRVAIHPVVDTPIGDRGYQRGEAQQRSTNLLRVSVLRLGNPRTRFRA